MVVDSQAVRQVCQYCSVCKLRTAGRVYFFVGTRSAVKSKAVGVPVDFVFLNRCLSVCVYM